MPQSISAEDAKRDSNLEKIASHAKVKKAFHT